MPCRIFFSFRWWPLVIAGLLVGGGCGQPPVVLQRYLLEYAPPPAGRQAPLAEGVRVELFEAPQYLSSPSMVYRPRPYEIKAYAYNRWQAPPAALVTDMLLRDLRASGLFQGVFGYQQGGVARFRVEGAVQEFAEVDEPEGWQAVLAVWVTLADLKKPEVTQRVILARNYRETEPLLEQTPAGLAAAMSRALARLSARITGALYDAAQRAASQD